MKLALGALLHKPAKLHALPVKTRTHHLATSQKRPSTFLKRRRRGGDCERLRIAAAGNHGDYFKTNRFSYTFTPKASADLGLIVVARIVAVYPAED